MYLIDKLLHFEACLRPPPACKLPSDAPSGALASVYSCDRRSVAGHRCVDFILLCRCLVCCCKCTKDSLNLFSELELATTHQVLKACRIRRAVITTMIVTFGNPVSCVCSQNFELFQKYESNALDSGAFVFSRRYTKG